MYSVRSTRIPLTDLIRGLWTVVRPYSVLYSPETEDSQGWSLVRPPESEAPNLANSQAVRRTAQIPESRTIAPELCIT